MKGNDTIAAISTAIGQGGIGIIRLSGVHAVEIADKLFRARDGKKLNSCGSHTIHYGMIVDGPAAKVRGSQKKKQDGLTADTLWSTPNDCLDEVLVTVMRAPRTYTREDVVEINCHGGVVALRRVLERVIGCGARVAEPGEFTKRAFLNGRIDLAQAEAVAGVIQAQTDTSLKLALAQLEGDFSKAIRTYREELLDILREIEAAIDFSHEDIQPETRDTIVAAAQAIKEKLRHLLNTGGVGMLMAEGVTCVIVGKPNAGKSSLLNALLKRNRAIVTPIPGTTRDVIEESMSIDGIAVKLVDTAGVTTTTDVVERHGVNRTKAYLRKANICIVLLDLSRPLDKQDRAILKLVSGQTRIVLANKSDKRRRFSVAQARAVCGQDPVEISVKRGHSAQTVTALLKEKIWQGKVTHPEPTFVTSLRHKKALGKAVRHLGGALNILKKDGALELAVIDVREAINQLGCITGETVAIDILDRIFSKFCIGK